MIDMFINFQNDAKHGDSVPFAFYMHAISFIAIYHDRHAKRANDCAALYFACSTYLRYY